MKQGYAKRLPAVRPGPPPPAIGYLYSKNGTPYRVMARTSPNNVEFLSIRDLYSPGEIDDFAWSQGVTVYGVKVTAINRNPQEAPGGQGRAVWENPYINPQEAHFI
jgi:hypothetical protein